MYMRVIIKIEGYIASRENSDFISLLKFKELGAIFSYLIDKLHKYNRFYAKPVKVFWFLQDTHALFQQPTI